jgi:hypothetical protein
MKTFLLISAVVVSAVSAMAQTSLFAVKQYDTGTVGITAGQTAKFNLLYPTIPAPVLQVLCSATLVIADDQGNILKTLQAPQMIAGKVVSLELNADTDLPGSARVQVYAKALTPSPGGTGASCNLIPTLEVVDNSSGKTTVVVKGKATWPLAPPTPAAN